jgi:hypothetical protein
MHQTLAALCTWLVLHCILLEIASYCSLQSRWWLAQTAGHLLSEPMVPLLSDTSNQSPPFLGRALGDQLTLIGSLMYKVLYEQAAKSSTS